MSMRISSPALLSLLLLAACSKGEEARQVFASGGDPEPVSEADTEDDTLPCALAKAKDFRPLCKIDKAQADGKELWIVRHPDGGFRRFVIVEQKDGAHIGAADGAFEVQNRRVGPNLEVKVGDDRYLFAATPEPASVSTSAPAG